MDPHAETIWKIGEFEHQDRMRKATQQRLAASAQSPAAPSWTITRAVQQAAAMRDLLRREIGAKRFRLSSLLPSG